MSFVAKARDGISPAAFNINAPVNPVHYNPQCQIHHRLPTGGCPISCPSYGPGGPVHGHGGGMNNSNSPTITVPNPGYNPNQPTTLSATNARPNYAYGSYAHHQPTPYQQPKNFQRPEQYGANFHYPPM